MNSIAESGPFFEGFISKLYAPKDTHNISPGERCFYTRENALIIDTLRKYISDSIEEDLQIYCLAPLLNKASIHTNTAGVFKGFYKKDGIGHFGGAGEHALDRIMRKIQLEYPVWNNELEYESVECHNKDINVLLDELKDNDLDILYLDPPYNQHPYGSNYFMLNLIAKGIEPSEISKVSGIPVEWNKSMYNSSLTAKDSMHQLINTGLKKSRYLLISYNDEGIISSDDWKELLDGLIIQKYEIVYDTYKGSRNLESRNNKVTEIMYLVSKPV
jgi:adenine-specific DNA-methyltransferase